MTFEAATTKRLVSVNKEVHKLKKTRDVSDTKNPAKMIYGACS